MKEGYYEGEIMTFESDRNTSTKPNCLAFCNSIQKLTNLQGQGQNQTHMISITNSNVFTFEHMSKTSF